LPIKRGRLDTDISEDVSFVRLQLLEDGWVITNHFEINDLETILRNSASSLTYSFTLLGPILGLTPWLFLSLCLEDSRWLPVDSSTWAILFSGRGAAVLVADAAVALTLISPLMFEEAGAPANWLALAWFDLVLV